MIKSQTTQEFGLSPMPTPDPARPGCRVMVSLADFSFDEIPAIGTRLADSGLNITKQNSTWSNHVFAGVADGPRGWIYFLFNPFITDPTTPFRSYLTKEDYAWPAVLKDLGAVRFRQIDDTGLYALTLHGAKYAFAQGLKLSTSVWVEEFISATAFDEEFLSGEEPIPTPIDAKYMDGRISFPACLHPDIEIPVAFAESTISNYLQTYDFVDFVAGNSSLDLLTPYKASKTNFLGWADFTLPAETRITESNMYYVIKKTFRAPSLNLFTVQ